ncbi:Zn-ribbon-containing protein [Photobacterium leiognathi]|uniref:Zn-ribbon-containing protein n=1 Tax=Photobacterium leiognathi TaxID=553611 RepID=UPI00298102D4|nr:Zn-ribbon-containing protein [Photobacterium leiognathi]
MYVVELQFECFDNTTLSRVDRAINGLMDDLRYNGQMLGREFPITIDEGIFRVRAVCPEKDSLHPKFNSPQVNRCFELLSDACLLAPKIKVLGVDLNSESVAETARPTWQVLYTTYVHTCSPLRSGDSLLPIPLYQTQAPIDGDHKALVKWQTEWQAFDEIQMANKSKPAIEMALHEIGDIDSELFIRGNKLRENLERQTQVPTYYYLYRVGGENLESEASRTCPSCGKDWRVGEPLHGLFHFKCDDCRLVSNLSWNFQ